MSDYFGDLTAFMFGLGIGLIIAVLWTLSLKMQLAEHRSRRRSRGGAQYEGIPTLSESKLEFMQKRSFHMLTRLQGIVGITDILSATNKHEIDPDDIKIIAEGARQIHAFLIEGLNLHTNSMTVDSVPNAEKITNRKVLLVEDDEMMRITSSEMLKTLGLECEVANNGKDCIEKIKANDYGLVIMDCEMPVMNGYEATLAIRGMPETKNSISIVGFTANAVRGSDKKCFAAGMNAYISKPIHLQELKAAITKFISL